MGGVGYLLIKTIGAPETKALGIPQLDGLRYLGMVAITDGLVLRHIRSDVLGETDHIGSGDGLLLRRPWARTLSIILAAAGPKPRPWRSDDAVLEAGNTFWKTN